MAARKSKAAPSRSRPRTNARAHSSSSRRTGRASSSGRAAYNRNGARRQAQPDTNKVIEFLSQMLAVERGGVMLYEKALDELADEDLREDLELFLEQTRRHVEICEELLEQAGASADQSSPAAQAAEAKANGLVSADVPEEMTDFNNIENLLLAETKDNWNWEMLGEISKSIGEREFRSAIGRAVREVSRQERRHVDWNSRTLSELARHMLMSHPGAGQMEEEEMGRRAEQR